MDRLISFFIFRPTFTVLGLRVVWYIYLANTVVQFYLAINSVLQVLAQRGISWESWSPNLVPLIFNAITQLVLVRVLVEVAAIIISDHESRPN
jgi:hypothetical protein